FLHSSTAHRDLHSFPTRRSSDLRSIRIYGTILAASPHSSVATCPRLTCPRTGRRSRRSCWQRPSFASSLVPGSMRTAEDVDFPLDRKSTRLNSSHSQISYAVFCL